MLSWQKLILSSIFLVPATAASAAADELNAGLGPEPATGDSSVSELSDPRRLLQAPPIPPLGPVTILVEPGRVIILGTGEIITEDSNWGHPLQQELAEALMYHARPGDVIGLRGDLSDRAVLMIGGGNVQDPATIYWPNGEWIRDVTIVGLAPNRKVKIPPVWIRDELSGVDNLRIQNVTIVNLPGTASPVHCHQGARVGLVRLYDVKIKGRPNDTVFQGYSYKFGVKGTGQWQLDMREVDIRPALYHGVYCDNVIGPTYFIDVETGGTTRTGFQITNRSQTSPIPGRGGVLFERCIVRGSTGTSGGSDFTATHMGPIVFRNCKSHGPKSGSLVVWSDVGNGLLLNPQGYTTDIVVIDGFEVIAPGSDRSHIMISGAQEVHLYDFDVRGSRAALDGVVTTGRTQHGGPIRNGEVTYHLPLLRNSLYNGFDSAEKVQYWTGGPEAQVLSDAQIDTL
jgi:hypothetical protein